MCVEIDPKDIKVSDGTVVVWKVVFKKRRGFVSCCWETPLSQMKHAPRGRDFIDRHGCCCYEAKADADKAPFAGLRIKCRIPRGAKYAHGFEHRDRDKPAMRAERLVPCEE